jgi:zinc transporter
MRRRSPIIALARIAESADRMTRTVEDLDAARDRAAVTQEELASRTAEITNQRLYLLAIITAVFRPLGYSRPFWTLCGLFGTGVAFQVSWLHERGWL